MRPRAAQTGAATVVLMLVAAAATAETGPGDAGLGRDALPVKIALTDGGFWFHNIGVRASAIDLEVSNQGKRKHALAIVARDQPRPLAVETRVLAPGASTELVLRLPPGQYEMFSPVDHDRDRGLAAPLKIVSPSPESRAGAEMNRIFYNY